MNSSLRPSTRLWLCARSRGRGLAVGSTVCARWGGIERSTGGGGSSRRSTAPPSDEPPPSRFTTRPPPREPPSLWGDEEQRASPSPSGWGDDTASAPPRYGRTGGGGGGGGGGYRGAAQRGGGGWAGRPASPPAPAAGPPRAWLTTREKREARDPDAPPPLADTLRGEAVYGVAPVRAALSARRRPLHTLYLQSSMVLSQRADASAVGAMRDAAASAGVPVVSVDKHELNLLTDNKAHQGCVLDCGPLEFEALRRMPSPPAASSPAPPPVWLALDEVSDPQNLGAVIRSAVFLGAAGVIVCARNSAPPSPAVSKASSGALETAIVRSVSNLPLFLDGATADGWRVLGADAGAAAADVCDATVDQPTLLVLGSEGSGLRTNVRAACAAMVRVPGGDALVDSLNVSVAAGIMLQALTAAARRSAAQQPAVQQPAVQQPAAQQPAAVTG